MMLQVLIDQKGGTVENEIRGGILHQKNVQVRKKKYNLRYQLNRLLMHGVAVIRLAVQLYFPIYQTN
jgi:hypothetical protein